MGTEIFEFGLWGAEIMGFKESNPISENMTKLTFHPNGPNQPQYVPKFPQNDPTMLPKDC